MGPQRSGSYGFRPVVDADLIVLHRWLSVPEVARWWGDPDEEIELMRGGLTDPAVALWLVEHGGRPFAYVQDYDLHAAWPDHPWPGLPAATRGIDQFIGDVDMLGRGHGSAFIRAFTDRLFLAGTSCVLTDPHPDNGRARRAYEKAGFRGERSYPADGERGPFVPMTRFLSDQGFEAPAVVP